MVTKNKILLAEDDEFLSSLIKNRLVKEGFSVETAKTGDEVLTKVSSFSPDFLLLDIILPGKLGFDILTELKAKEETKNLPFIVLSNLGQESDMKKASDMGAIAYYVKSKIMIDEIVKKISEVLKNQ